MKRSVFSLAAFLVMASMSLTAVAQGDAAAGEQKVLVCGACHGPDGNSAIGANPKLAGQNANYTFRQLVDIRDGNREVEMMAGMLNGMSDQDLQDMAAFYATQQITLEGADPELIELGARLYRFGNAELGIAACSACHSPTGKGNAQAGFPALGGQHAEYTANQMRAFRAGTRTNDGDTRMMRIVAERMTDQEIQAVSSYISGLH